MILKNGLNFSSAKIIVRPKGDENFDIKVSCNRVNFFR